MTDVVQRARTALGEHVTPGPWVVNTEGWAVISSGSDSVIHGYVDTECEGCGAEIKGDSGVAISIEDAEFIAAARTLVPELVAEIERLRQQRTIETVEQLDALPEYSVVRDRVGEVWMKDLCANSHQCWWRTGSDGAHSDNAVRLSARLLWLPEWGNA